MAINESILEDNIDVPVIYDTDLIGGINSKGQIKQIWGEEALNNSIKMWIASFKGEVLRDPDRAGYITQWLMKSMAEENIDDIEMAVRDGIDQDFYPALTILNLSITPDFTRRVWNFYLEVYSDMLKIRTVVSETIKAQV